MIKIFTRYKLLKFLVIFLLLLPLMLFLNTCFLIESYWKIVQAVIFAIILTLILIWPELKKRIFYIALTLIIVMLFFYTLDLIYLADIVGSTGAGLVLINIVCYLPQLVKVG